MDRGVTEEQKSLASGSSQSHEPDSWYRNFKGWSRCPCVSLSSFLAPLLLLYWCTQYSSQSVFSLLWMCFAHPVLPPFPFARWNPSRLEAQLAYRPQQEFSPCPLYRTSCFTFFLPISYSYIYFLCQISSFLRVETCWVYFESIMACNTWSRGCR